MKLTTNDRLRLVILIVLDKCPKTLLVDVFSEADLEVRQFLELPEAGAVGH